MSTPANETPIHPFGQSTFNKIYYGIVAVASIGLFLAFAEKTSFQFGRLAGQLIIFILVPSIFAWIVWRLFGRKQGGGNVTFNIVLTLILLGKLGQVGNQIQQSKEMDDLQVQMDQFKQQVSDSNDPEELEAAVDNFTASVKDGFDRLSASSTGSEKRFYEIMGEVVSETQAMTERWHESLSAVQDSRILDYSLLTTDEEFQYQKDTIGLYVAHTKTYGQFFNNMLPNLKKRLSVLGAESEIAKGAIEGATNTHLAQKPVLEPLLGFHTAYGENMLQILDMLQQDPDGWIYEEDELQFYEDSLLEKYQKLTAELARNEASINTLSGKLAEILSL